ncbi:MAG: hypothetical protein RIS87_81 [Pseudomonadota bacterium]|jgi:hypothetical protein
MFVVLNKKLLWIIVIWFAILQMLSPLIHAHMEVDAPSQGHGLHVHLDEDTSLLQTSGLIKTPAFKEFSTSMHTIGVDKALVKKLELLQTPVFAVLFAIFSMLLIAQLVRIKPKFRFLLPHPFFLKSQSRPRAPPFF